MSPFSIYLCVPEYLAQWFAHECAEHHFVAEDKTPRSLDPMEAVEPIKGSQESMVLEMYLQKQPKAVPEPMPEGANLCVGIPYFKGKSPFTYNYLPPKGQRHLKRVISNRFKLQLWDEIHTIETLVGEQAETITLWMENHGIAFSDKNWNAVAKIYQRMRGVYRLRGTRAMMGRADAQDLLGRYAAPVADKGDLRAHHAPSQPDGLEHQPLWEEGGEGGESGS